MSITKAKITFYTKLETLLSAGVPLITIFRSPMPYALTGPCRKILQKLEADASLSDAIATQPAIFSPLERALLSAGEQAGNLPEQCKLLKDTLEEEQRSLEDFKGALLYPFVCYVVAGPVLLFAKKVMRSIAGHSSCNLESIAKGLLFPVLLWWVAPFLLFILLRILWKFCSQNPTCNALLSHLPIIGSLLYYRESIPFWKTLGTCLKAGIDVLQTLQLLADTSPSLRQRKRARHIHQAILERGSNFSNAYAETATPREWQKDLPPLLESAELSGTLETTTARICDMQIEQYRQMQKRLKVLLPTIVFLFIAVYLGFQIVQFASAYVSQLNQLLE